MSSPLVQAWDPEDEAELPGPANLSVPCRRQARQRDNLFPCGNKDRKNPSPYEWEQEFEDFHDVQLSELPVSMWGLSQTERVMSSTWLLLDKLIPWAMHNLDQLINRMIRRLDCQCTPEEREEGGPHDATSRVHPATGRKCRCKADDRRWRLGEDGQWFRATPTLEEVLEEYKERKMEILFNPSGRDGGVPGGGREHSIAIDLGIDRMTKRYLEISRHFVHIWVLSPPELLEIDKQAMEWVRARPAVLRDWERVRLAGPVEEEVDDVEDLSGEAEEQ